MASLQAVVESFISRVISRAPDFVIGGHENPYLMRWWVIPRNRVFNIYLHLLLRDDDDRALHDHPWINMSLLLRGEYTEHTIAAGGINQRRKFRAGNCKLRWPWSAHRIELHAGACWSLFITGPAVRQWGFHCADSGWIHWKQFTAADDSGKIGKGCE